MYSDTPKLIQDAIISRRPRKTQTKPYVMPNITSTLKYGTVSLIPEDACIRCGFEVAFIDSLGSVDMTFEWGSSILRIHPSVDHYRSGSTFKMTIKINYVLHSRKRLKIVEIHLNNC